MQVIIQIYWRIDAVLEWLIVAIAENMHALSPLFAGWLCNLFSHLTIWSSENLCISLESWGVGSMRRSKDSVHVNHILKGKGLRIKDSYYQKKKRIKDRYITNKVHTLLPNLASMWPIHGIGSALISLSVQNFVTSVKLSFYRNWYQNI